MKDQHIDAWSIASTAYACVLVVALLYKLVDIDLVLAAGVFAGVFILLVGYSLWHLKRYYNQI